ncbi:YceD family protein [Leptolyngbya sp. AN02str]|uniref:YceD family protein n=1 Tax=Leptolyngbya sp. AN02str TaxID=3423363 RepID=UPI003D3140DE
MSSIHIPQLTRSPEQSEKVDIDSYLPGLESLTPVHGTVKVTHRGNYLEVAGQAETIVTLACDRCLQNYNHRLAVKASELIWLEEPEVLAENTVEREVAYDDLVEVLSPQGYFDPEAWIYEQMCLQMPMRKLCDQQCGGIPLSDELPAPQEQASLTVDSRWASLEALKKELWN